MRAILLLPVLVSFGGCALHYVDAAGNRHIAGIVHLTLPPGDQQNKAADWLRMRTIGVAINHTDIGGALELGYSDNTIAAIQNNSCAVLPKGARYAAQNPLQLP